MDRARNESSPESTEYSLLLRQFGEAMARIGRLEAQVERLALQLRDGPETQTNEESPEAAVGLQPEETDAGTVESGAPSGNGDVGQLRMQLSATANELAQTRDELEKALGSRSSGRRRRGHHRPWWEKAARRLGLRPSSRQ
jgi:uncharacterized protein with von Willebrand factor type A (vWA) domain